MTLRNRLGAVAALSVAGALVCAAPVSAATSHSPVRTVIVAVAPVPTPGASDGQVGLGPVDGNPSNATPGGSNDLPSLAPSSAPLPAGTPSGAQAVPPTAGTSAAPATPTTPAKPGKQHESQQKSSSSGSKWFGLGGGLLAGIVLGLGFAVLRKRKGGMGSQK